jgi:hypothetical protein
MMLRPLSPGQHEVVFGGSIPTNGYPVLSDFSSEMTYVLNVVEAPPATMIGPEAAPAWSSSFANAVHLDRAIELLDPDAVTTM